MGLIVGIVGPRSQGWASVGGSPTPPTARRARRPRDVGSLAVAVDVGKYGVEALARDLDELEVHDPSLGPGPVHADDLREGGLGPAARAEDDLGVFPGREGVGALDAQPAGGDVHDGPGVARALDLRAALPSPGPGPR